MRCYMKHSLKFTRKRCTKSLMDVFAPGRARLQKVVKIGISEGYGTPLYPEERLCKSLSIKLVPKEGRFMPKITESFWKYENLTTNNLDSLLDKEDVTLNEILDNEGVIQECKSKQKKLIDL